MKTRSVCPSQVFWLSFIWNGGGGIAPFGSSLGLRGPIPPMCTHIDADPGPPLKQNVSGRCAASVAPSSVYAM